MKKNVVSFFIVLIILELITVTLNSNLSIADSYRYEYVGTVNYPGFKERIDIIKQNHPNWNFTIMQTGLDWNSTIAAEYTGHHVSPKNLIQGKTGGWICSICGEQVYDTGNWMCASEAAIKYYMDTRNWLVDSPYLFQFLQLDYLDTTDNEVYSSLNGTFLYSMENASLINKVCKEKNANVYFIVARILQEQGNAGGTTYRMTDTDGTVYYNIFNIGASGNGDEVYVNAINKAKSMGWTTLEKCISDGISFILSTYISYKQNTLYLNKFDVESYNGTYVKQYMQNVEAPKTEAISMYNRMKNANLLDKNLNFIIPVYENMPQTASYSPDDIGELYPKNIRVKEGHSGIMVRAARSTTSTILYRIANSSEIVLSVERFSDGWHKVVMTNGLTGFLKFDTNYMEEIDDIINCNEAMEINDNEAILRVGPGINQTEITTLSLGEKITRIDNSARYTFDGKIWDRVVISDGRQGFITREKLKYIGITNNTDNNIILSGNMINENVTDKNTVDKNEITQNMVNENEKNENIINSNVIANQIINQNSINDSKNVIDNVIENQQDNIINNIQNDISNNIRNDISNQDNNIQNIMNSESVTNIANDLSGQEVNNKETAENIKNTIIENSIEESKTLQNQISENIEENKSKYLIISPDKLAKDLDGIVTKDGIKSDEAGTGYNININGENFTIIKRGDVNGDATIKANDYLIIKDYIMGILNKNLEEPYLIAADVTNDNLIKANDYLKIKDHIMYGIEIQ